PNPQPVIPNPQFIIPNPQPVIPAKVGIQKNLLGLPWIPASAGMTKKSWG
ncbi:MAG: hypothetical protein UZ16_OP3001000909, partial [Candidatus Hinthialibacteria bacterium OLB16]